MVELNILVDEWLSISKDLWTKRRDGGGSPGVNECFLRKCWYGGCGIIEGRHNYLVDW